MAVDLIAIQRDTGLIAEQRLVAGASQTIDADDLLVGGTDKLLIGGTDAFILGTTTASPYTLIAIQRDTNLISEDVNG